MADLKSLGIPRTHTGEVRKAGIEVELGVPDEDRAGVVLADSLGGTLWRTPEYERRVEGSEIGGIEILLDTVWRSRVEGQVARAGLELGRAVIPVEFVTEPLAPEQIADVDRACRALAAAGATGTRSGCFLGSGFT